MDKFCFWIFFNAALMQAVFVAARQQAVNDDSWVLGADIYSGIENGVIYYNRTDGVSKTPAIFDGGTGRWNCQKEDGGIRVFREGAFRGFRVSCPTEVPRHCGRVRVESRTGCGQTADCLAASGVGHAVCHRSPATTVSQGHATWRVFPVIGDLGSAERLIPPKPRGQSVNPGKHPSAGLTKKETGQNKQPGINTSCQSRENLLKGHRYMSTPWQTANRKQLRRPMHPGERRQAAATVCADAGLLPKAPSAAHCAPYPKHIRSKFPSANTNETMHAGPEIAKRSLPWETQKHRSETLINGIYFAQGLQKMCEVSLSEWDGPARCDPSVLRDVHEMDTAGCGSGQNRLVVFDDGTKACVRYRPNIDQIQGEVYSYYLSKLLGLNNVPRPVVTTLEPDSRQWSRVRDLAFAAQWATGSPFVLTHWIENLTEIHIPPEILGSDEKLYPGMLAERERSVWDICQLVQWSDLVIFDFLTGHLDRVVNMMHNSKWSPRIFSKPVHNLMASRTSAKLVFLDNESGLVHGYRALAQFSAYHERLLKSVCLFRRSTAVAVRRLHNHGNVGERLHALFTGQEVNHHLIPSLPESVTQTLQHRIALVHRHIQNCASTRII